MKYEAERGDDERGNVAMSERVEAGARVLQLRMSAAPPLYS